MTVSFGTLLPCPAREGKAARTEDDEEEDSGEEDSVAKKREMLLKAKNGRSRWLKEPGVG